MEKYFKSKKELDKEIFDKLDDLVEKLSKGFWKNRITDVLKENIVYSISIFGETNKMVFVEFDVVSAVLSVKFNFMVNNQKVLALFRGSSVKQNNYVVLKFDQFTEETEVGLVQLIKDYFAKGSSVLKDIVL
jgi:hypothetical protein